MKKITISNSNVGKVRSNILLDAFHCFPCSLAPHVGALNFHSLLELRRGLQYGRKSSPCCFLSHTRTFIRTGIVLLDLEEEKIECIYEAILNDAIANGQMNKDVKDELLRVLTSPHQYEFD